MTQDADGHQVAAACAGVRSRASASELAAPPGHRTSPTRTVVERRGARSDKPSYPGPRARAASLLRRECRQRCDRLVAAPLASEQLAAGLGRGLEEFAGDGRARCAWR